MSSSDPSRQKSVWRAPGMPALLSLTAAGFAGFAALLPMAPLWAVHGGADEAGSGLVNGALLLATVLTQGFVPRLLQRLGTGRVLAAGLLLLGGPSLLMLISDQLGWILALSLIRGVGFGILTVTGSAAVAHLVAPARHGAAIGAYGAAIAVPQLLLLPAGPWLADTIGFWAVFALGTLPLLGIAAAPRLAQALRVREAEQARRRPAQELDLPAEGTTATAGRRLPRLPGGLFQPMILLLAVTLAGGALITFVPQMSSSPAATTGGLALLTATAAVSRWRLGALADRHGTKAFLWPLVLLTCLGLVLAALAVKNQDATRVPLLLVAMTIIGITYGGLQNLTLLLSLSAVRPAQYGTASAVWNMGFDAGTGLGSVLVGALAAGLSFPIALLVAAGISLATLPLALMRQRAAPSA
ncbi:MAG: MFS transporter [Micrococcaceae bacterium]|nr:MFS transporter [Micrococcaceae bacterium]MDN5887051.1 MFS transporter [Micrococcaceae bacterium]MDN5906631.1 MFS transporter [Micrococcaceae bacterium]MDN6169976.1 MFS transporter [Micrococcaceae bacterium]